MHDATAVVATLKILHPTIPALGCQLHCLSRTNGAEVSPMPVQVAYDEAETHLIKLQHLQASVPLAVWNRLATALTRHYQKILVAQDQAQLQPLHQPHAGNSVNQAALRELQQQRDTFIAVVQLILQVSKPWSIVIGSTVQRA